MLVAVLTAAALMINARLPTISPLVAAVVLGAIIGNLGAATDSTQPGLTLAAKRLLRLGVVLLGLRLSLAQVLELGPVTVIVVVTTVVVTFFGTQIIGRRLGLSNDLSLLVATGYSICGASAIAAMESSTDAEDDEVAASIGLVTLCGTLAMFVIPQLASVFGLTDEQLGVWVGASIHDVAQVVAAGSAGGAPVLATAVVVKLTRVSLLAPLVIGVNVRARSTNVGSSPERPAVLPLFVAGFLGMVALRTSGILSADVLHATRTAEKVLLTAALAGLGSGVRFASLRRLGPASLVLGFAAWGLVAAASLLGVVLLG